MASKHYYTIAEAKTLLSSFDAFSNSESKESLKHFMTTCNSLAITFLQHSMLQEASFCLEKSSEADKWFEGSGSFIDKAWQGRVVLHLAKGYLFNRKTDNQEFLSELYKSQDLCLYIRESLGPPSADVLIAVNLLTFTALFKINEFKESRKYIDQVQLALRSVLQRQSASKLSKICQQNLVGIAAMCESVLLTKVDHSTSKAKHICKKALDSLKGEDLLVRPLLSDLIYDLGTQQDWLMPRAFENLMFISLFMPFIDPFAPLIAPSELKPSPAPKVVYKPVQHFAHKKKFTVSKKINTKTNEYTVKHWWEKPGFIDNALKGAISGIPSPMLLTRARSRRRPRLVVSEGERSNDKTPSFLSRNNRRSSVDNEHQFPDSQRKPLAPLKASRRFSIKY